MNAVELTGVSIKRGFHVILQIERLTIARGQFVSVIGPNGAGKSTFLKLCGRLIRPSRGRICLNSERIGYIPQQGEYNTQLPFTVRDIVAMGRNALKSPGRRLDRHDYEHVDDWLGQVGLYERRTQSFRSLSGGQQQKALIARAMVGEPDFVLLDEPAANLDAEWKRQFRQTLDDVYERCRMTVLLVSHDIDLLPESCQRVLSFCQGRIVSDTLPEGIMAEAGR
jgi:zinc transport system ATP-binding protein